MPLNVPREEYASRVKRRDAAIAATDRRDVFVSNLRLVVFGAGAVLAWLTVGRGAASPAWLLVPAAAFLALVVVHAHIIERGVRAGRARRLYERGLERIDGRWVGTGPDGARFLDNQPYARDLDVFGSGSVFQLIDAARTEIGEETLAAWLGAPAALVEVRARQPAVEELRLRLDFREDLAVLAAEAHVGRTSALAAWAALPPAGLTRRLALGLAASALVTAILGIAVAASRVPPAALVTWVLVQSAAVLPWRHRVAEVLGRIDTAAHDLGLLSSVLGRVEREPFDAPRLQDLRAALTTDGLPPSRRIAQLRRLVSLLDSTRNQLFAPIAALLLVRSQAAVAIDRWHAKYGVAIGEWLRAIGELEALSSLAAYAYEHPADPFPVLSDEGPIVDGAGIAHPLLPEATAVRNDVRLGGDAPHVLIVSGSNMSGKSTLLRAVGVNVVLALAGAPVRAVSLRLSQLAIGATLRVEDSLQAGRSRFYAEILRVRAIVEIARGQVPLLFLLDEILHGTNSYDRRIGAEAIVRALVAAGAIGLVTTHDLALTELVATLGPAAANVHFEDRIENGRIVFDYRMRPGVVERSNALALMRAVGLDV